MSSQIQQATVISIGARIEGDLQLDHDAVITGEITGDLYTNAKLQITETAQIHGNVFADEVELAGRVGGTLTVKHRTQLLAGAKVEGKLDTGSLSAHGDATFNGVLCLRGSHAVTTSSDLAASQPTSDLPAENDAPATTPSLPFAHVTGTANAGLRTRRRAALSSPA